MGLQKSIVSKLAAAFVVLAGLGGVESALAGCSYELTPTDRTHGFGAITAKVSVASSSSGCAWTVVNTNSWITILAGASGTGDGDVTYVLAGNPNPATRTGIIRIAGQDFTVTQTGVTCTYSISPPSHDKCFGSTTGSVQVSAQSPCPWTIVNPNNWILITSGNAGTGSDKVFYTVLANTGSTSRTGNVLIAGQVFTINQAPYPVTCTADKQVECGAAWDFDAPTLNGSDVTNQTIATVTNFLCGKSFTATRSWTVTDRCGNVATCSQTVSAMDVTPPVMTCAGDKSAECGAAWSFDPPTASDGCDGANVSIAVAGTVTNLGCGQTFTATRTWRATDACGNSTTCSQTVSAVDATPPVVTCAADKTVECGAAWSFDPPTASDGCDGANVSIAVAGTVTNLGCGQTFTATRTWRATDACGNSTTCSQTVSAVDATPPVVTCAADKTVECGAAWSFDPPTASDGCDGANVSIAVAGTITNLGCGQTFTATRTWRATDACGNMATCSQTVSSVDVTPPVVTCAADKTVECGAAWSFDMPTANDGCDGANVSIAVAGTITNLRCGQTFTATRTWRATDACGNMATCSQTVSAVDVTPPVVTCAADKTVECGVAWAFDLPTASDGCDGTNVGIVVTGTITNLGCGQTFTATRTWRATDACGNMATCSQTVSSVDVTPPVVTCAADKTVECGAAWSFDMPTASDGCDGTNVGIVVTGTITNLGCGKTFTATRTWRATDACGNMATCSQTVSAVDVTPPVVTCAANKTVECGVAWSFDMPTASDGCDGTNVGIVVTGTITNLGCGQTFTATRTWRATDACGNMATCSQTVSSVDVTPPVVTCAANKTVECGAAWSFDMPTASDGCDGTNAGIVVTGTITNLGCGKTFTATRTWRATDACGNMATCSQTVSSVDVTPPVVTCAADKTVECGVAWSFDMPTASDGCDGTNVGIVVTGTITNLGCGKTFTATRTWRATDACGNMATCSQTVSAVDVTPPVVTCAANKTVECGVAWSFDMPTASDGCDGTNVGIVVTGTITNLGCGKTFTATRTWRATDACGNTATCSQTVSSVDVTPPVVTCAADKTVECGAAWSFDMPTASDSCDGTNLGIVVTGTITNLGCGKTFTATRTWRATDACGNMATCSQTVSAVDVTPPVVTCAADKTVECGVAWAFDLPTASDGCDGANVSIAVAGTITNLGCGQTFTATRTWRATDACGNMATCSQTVSSVDVTPPVVTCAADKTVECGAAWSFDPPTASDGCDGANVSIAVAGTVTNLGCGQTFTATRTWRATDACGNMATCSQTVSSVDVTPPVVTCAANKTVECGVAWSFDMPTASDGCDGTNVGIVVTGTITNLGCGQTFTATRTWRATDACGNMATCSQTVSSVDVTPPVVTCAANKTVECGVAWSFDMPTASDGCDGTNVGIVVTGTITNLGCGKTFTATRTWRATDACGNMATCSQTVSSVDVTPPVVTCAANKSVECGVAWSFDMPTASDGCDGTNVGIVVTGTITNLGCGKTFTATRTWRATDACGNMATCSQTVSSVDVAPPVVTCAANKTVECGAAWSFDMPTASDGCDGTNVGIVVTGTITNLGCGQTFTATRTWRATDACGNMATCSQTVSSVDVTPPVVTCAADKTVECGAAWSFDMPTASDGCDGTNVGIVVTGTITNLGCGKTFTATRTWRATDACGNMATCSQTVSAVDVTPPVVTCAANKTVECGVAWSFDMPTASDGCDGTNVGIVVTGTITNLGCGQTFIATRTWRATDACGNMATCSQTVQVTNSALVVACPTNRIVPCNEAWTFDTPGVSGGCGPMITITSTITNFLCGATYNATRVWMITDGCVTNTCTQIVEVKDQTPPMIVCPPDMIVTNVAEMSHCPKTLTEFVMGGGQISDNCGAVHYRCGDSVLIAEPCGGVIERMHIAFDDCGNTNICIQRIIVLGNMEVTIGVQAADTNIDVCLGGTLTFCATVSGSGPFFYNWLLDDIHIPGADGPCLTLTNLNPADVGRYSVQVISQCETVTKGLSLPACGTPQPLILGVQFVPAGVRLTFKGLPGRAYRILHGTDFTKAWTLIGSTTTGADGAGEFIDTSGNQAECRMYKLLGPTSP